jgi:hypothetical protein
MAQRKRKQTRSVAVLVPIGFLIFVGLIAWLVLRPVAAVHEKAVGGITCPAAPDVAVGNFEVPAGPIAGYCQPELINAVQVIRAARSMGLKTRPQEIGLMTAIGESGLRNLNFGDTAGPDSRGMFQQRSNYGSLADRLDPYVASRAFFARMLGVPGWSTRPPTEVAHAVQENADPNYYTQFWTRAETLEFGLYGYQLLLLAQPHHL